MDRRTRAPREGAEWRGRVAIVFRPRRAARREVEAPGRAELSLSAQSPRSRASRDCGLASRASRRQYAGRRRRRARREVAPMQQAVFAEPYVSSSSNSSSASPSKVRGAFTKRGHGTIESRRTGQERRDAAPVEGDAQTELEAVRGALKITGAAAADDDVGTNVGKEPGTGLSPTAFPAKYSWHNATLAAPAWPFDS